jgi:GAF domain/PilZ domain/Sel1 repeat
VQQDFGTLPPMAAMTSALRPVIPNRRRRVRHKIQAPAYATFTTEAQSALLDLHEILDISEEGVAIQCHEPLEANQPVSLCLDLAECEQPIYTAGVVIWANGSGRAGLRFSALSPASLIRLREWLFLNAMAGVANSEAGLLSMGVQAVLPRPDYTDTLTAVSAVQREVEALGPDLAGALHLIARRAETLLRASGAAIALATSDPNLMDCRASAGASAPPVGARLQVGSGFSGECVKTGRLLRCDDADVDSRVDSEACRALGLRSILAAPVRVGEKSIGILEAFSPQPNAFSEADSRALQRLAETVLAAVNRAARAEDLPTLDPPPPVEHFAPTPGSVLFASAPAEQTTVDKQEKHFGVSLPLSHLVILIFAAIAIFFVLGYSLAPWIETKLQARGRSHLQTVFASSQASKPEALSPPAIETATIEQLRQMADKGNAAAENALGLRYFQGDEVNGIAQDEKEAFRWFTSAADHGNLPAQTKLGFLYWSGRGVPKDLNKAYFWTVVARTRGDQGNRDLGTLLASGMTRAQAAAIEEQAGYWIRHQPTANPGH